MRKVVKRWYLDTLKDYGFDEPYEIVIYDDDTIAWVEPGYLSPITPLDHHSISEIIRDKTIPALYNAATGAFDPPDIDYTDQEDEESVDPIPRNASTNSSEVVLFSPLVPTTLNWAKRTITKGSQAYITCYFGCTPLPCKHVK